MKARAMTQEFIDEFWVYFMDPTNKHMSSLLLKCGLPGGMMGSMMADLKGVHSGINMILRGKNEPELSLTTCSSCCSTKWNMYGPNWVILLW